MSKQLGIEQRGLFFVFSMWCACMCVTAACTIDLNQIDGWQGVGTSRAVAAWGGRYTFLSVDNAN